MTKVQSGQTEKVAINHHDRTRAVPNVLTIQFQPTLSPSNLAMFRPASRSLLIRSSSLRHASRAQAPFSRRFLNTAPPHKTSRSWKGTALRWGLAGAAVYYYNTSNIFAEQPSRKPAFPFAD
jgi:hypothetical protein